MASTKAFLDFVLEQLSALEDVSYRAMMGEYVLYCSGKVIGGVYDDRFLLKAAPAALRILDAEDARRGHRRPRTVLPPGEGHRG